MLFRSCGFILLQGRAEDRRAPLQGGWQLIWKGSRPGDNRELFSVIGCKSDAGVTGCPIAVPGWLSDRGASPRPRNTREKE